MSISVMTTVWKHSQQKGSNLLILLAIADFANDAGEAYPSVKTLMHKGRMSESSVHRSLRQLQADGELEIDRGKGPRGCNIYRVSIWQGASNGTGGVPLVTVGGATGGTQTVIEPSEEPSPTVSSATAPETVGAAPRKKPASKTPEVTQEFRERMQAKYQHIDPQDVTDQIDLALSHKAATKYGNTELYVQNWLKKDFPPAAASSKGSQPSNLDKLLADQQRELAAKQRRE